MKTRYSLLVGLFLLICCTAHAQCPVPTNVAATQVAATSTVIRYDDLNSFTRGVYGSYSYAAGTYNLTNAQRSGATFLLGGLPPATLVTVTLYTRCLSQIPEIPTSYSAPVVLTFTTLNALATRQAPELAALTLSPNPAHATATLELPLVAGVTRATLRLHDTLGRLVRTESVPLGKAVSLNLAGLPSGVYVLQVQAGNVAAMRRLVVE